MPSILFVTKDFSFEILNDSKISSNGIPYNSKLPQKNVILTLPKICCCNKKNKNVTVT